MGTTRLAPAISTNPDDVMGKFPYRKGGFPVIRGRYSRVIGDNGPNDNATIVNTSNKLSYFD